MPNTYDLEGNTAVVTGGAKGIGHAIAQLLLASGAHVTIWDLLEPAVPGATARVVDVTDPSAIAAAVAALPAGTTPDILVNSAGYLGLTQPFAEHRPDDWARIVSVNLLGTLQVTQALLPRMLAAGGARIINMGSLAGKEGLGTLTAYSAASGGVVAFTKALGRELAGRNIRVHCIAPGPIDTDMIRDLGTGAVEAMIRDSPLARLGRAEEVAQLAAWLASDACSFSTGAVYDISGGRARY